MSVDKIPQGLVEELGLYTGTTLSPDHAKIRQDLSRDLAEIETSLKEVTDASERAIVEVFLKRSKDFHERAAGAFQSAESMEAGSPSHSDTIARARALLAEALNWAGIADGFLDALNECSSELEEIAERLADKDHTRNQRRLLRSAQSMVSQVQTEITAASREEALDRVVARGMTIANLLEQIETRIYEDTEDNATIWGVSLGWRDLAAMVLSGGSFYLMLRFGAHPLYALAGLAVILGLYRKVFD